ncbi:hypothetical protein [Kitasatospora sp. NPDC056531]|uniref:hypothetical protein n=1 Tax=Kitasatospora sp. NPDC056531 TaxID=3345856 RepID=UPI0036BD1645
MVVHLRDPGGDGDPAAFRITASRAPTTSPSAPPHSATATTATQQPTGPISRITPTIQAIPIPRPRNQARPQLT